MKYSLLILGLLFLWNPEVMIIDVIPDFVGFLMLAKALTPLAPISPSAESAAEKFRKLAIISGIKTAAILPMMSLGSTEPEITMVFTAGFGILTAIFLFPAFSDLFAAITYFADRSQTKAKGTAFVKNFTFVAFLLRYALAFFPETVYLNVDESLSEIYQYAVYPWEPFRTGITVLAVAISLIIGLIWLAVILRYAVGLKRNRPLNEGIATELTHATIPYGKALLSAARPALLLFTLATFATVSFAVDGVPLFPAVLPPILLLIAVLYLKTPLHLSHGYLVLPILATVSGAVSHLSVMHFCEEHHDRAAISFGPYQEAFRLPFVTESISFALQGACFLFCLWPILRKAIASRPHNTEGMVANASDRQEQLRLFFLSVIFTVLMILYAVGRIVAYWFFYRSQDVRLFATLFGAAIGFFGWYLFSSLRQWLADIHES